MLSFLLFISVCALPASADIVERPADLQVRPAPLKREPPPRVIAPSAPAPKVAKGAGVYKNGAGLTGVKWSTGIEAGKPGSTGARRGQFSNEGAGLCGEGQDLWSAAGKVMSSKLIPQNKGYDLLAPAWPSFSGAAEALRCHYGAGKVSMCTSATAAALCQHFSDLAKAGSVSLTPAQIRFLNGPQVKAAVNGNTYSLAYLIQQLGGASLHGQGSTLIPVLSEAKTGDLLRFDRSNGTGHSTIFQKLEPSSGQFCYWSSNTLTNGTGVQCENISSLSEVVVSRFPADLDGLPAKIDKMAGPWGMGQFTARRANAMKASEVPWATSLDCPEDSGSP